MRSLPPDGQQKGSDWLSSKPLSPHTFVSRRDFLSVSLGGAGSQDPPALPALTQTNGLGLRKLGTAFKVDTSGSARLQADSFLPLMVRWLSDHQQQLDELFGHSDALRSGSVHLQEFKLGLMNLAAPCQQSQLHMLTEQLKTTNNTIRYRHLSSQVQKLRLSDAQTSEDVSCLDRSAQHLLNPEEDSFIHLRVRLIPFDSAAAHPGHFGVVLSSSSRIYHLIRMIQDRTGIQTSRFEVFRRRVPSEEARLPPERSLEECGFQGGSEGSPPEDTVYYDYRLLFTDCPVLNCDHYYCF